MPQYTFVRTKDGGGVQRGVLTANSYEAALAQAKRLGGTVREVKEVSSIFAFFHRGNLTLKERIIFSEQLAVMIKAGITLLQGLRSLEEEASKPRVRTVISALANDVEGGAAFSDALEKHPRVFSAVYCHMIRSAEKSGNLADVLERLTLQQQKEYELRGKVRGALMYPGIISVLLVGVVILIITFVLPRLSGLFSDTGTELPASTRFLLALSYFFTNFWYLAILGVVGGSFLARLIVRTEKGGLIWDIVRLRIPVLGTFIRKAIIARFAQTFAFLSLSGVPVLDTFKILKGVVGSPVYAREIDRISHDVENGVPISMAIRKSGEFPGMVGQLIKVGEQSGDLGGMFGVLGEFFDKEVDAMAKNLSTLLEPIIMIVMGAVIGFVLISVLQPMYGLMNAI